jgi:hypothetical protein
VDTDVDPAITLYRQLLELKLAGRNGICHA